MIRTGALVCAVVAEALALYTFAEWFAAGYDVDRRALAWWTFVGVALVAFVVPRATAWLALPARAAYATLWVVGYVVVYGFIRISYGGDFALWDYGWVADFVADSDTASGKGSHAAIATFMLVGLWIRESLRSVDDLDLETMPRVLGPLFGLVTIVAVLGAMTSRAGEVGRAAAAFYAVAIPALAFSQLALSGVTLGQVRAGGITATLLAATVGATLVCVAVAGVAFAVLGPTVGPVLDRSIELVLTIILTPPAIVLAWFFDLLFADVAPEVQITDLAPRQQPEEGDAGEDEGWSAKRIGAAGFRSLLVLGVILGVIAAVAYFSRLRRRVQEREEAGPVRAAVGSLGEDFGGLWRSLMPRRRGAPETRGDGVAALYHEVLVQAERTGHARKPSETPAEFAPVLESTFHRPVTDEITYAYEQARYAGREPDAVTLASLERRWRESP